MVIIYGYREKFKREGLVGHTVCSNCRHDADQSLCRQIYQVTLFYIPVFSHLKQRGIMCESCGNIIPISKQEYRQRRNDLINACH